MPPKKGTARSTRGARRGRGGRTPGAKDHARALSDIAEESLSQPYEQNGSVAPVPQQRTKKRSFQEISGGEDAIDTGASNRGRETRSQAAKKARHSHETTVPASVQQALNNEQDIEEQPLVTRITLFPLPYTPSPALLSFVSMNSLDTNDDSETIALNLIDLTLNEENWHPGLSGMIQPAACFLVASLLTRRQNLVEDVAASVETSGVGYGDLVEGYGLLWQWRNNLEQVVGAYAENLNELPDPMLFLKQGPYEQANDDTAGEAVLYEEVYGRPEPERW